MDWKALLQPKTVVVPYVGNRRVYSDTEESWLVKKRPRRFGWYEGTCDGSKYITLGTESTRDDAGKYLAKKGYLIGQRFVEDGTNPYTMESVPKIFLVDPDLDILTRATAVRHEDRWVFLSEEYPDSVEDEARAAYEEGEDYVSIPGITPELIASLNWLAFLEAEHKKKLEEIRKRAEEEEKRKKLLGMVGSAEGRRKLALLNFDEAARVALELGGGKFLSSRPGARDGEKIVKYKVRQYTIFCTIRVNGLLVMDSGICLIDHDDGDRAYDTELTLQSLPIVVKQADDIGRLVIFRRYA